MSKRNSQEAKRAARERLRAEREKQAKRERIRRQVIVGVSVVGVLAVASGIGFAVTKMNEPDKPSRWALAKKEKLVKPANTTGKNGTTIEIGDGKAKKTVDAYEDMRCPACSQFEQAMGSVLVKGADQGKYKLHVHIGDLIDRGPGGGEGSKNALSALGAALNVSKDAFTEYRAQMYSAQYHPDETQDKFAQDSYLLKVANTVPALKNNKSFQHDVKKGTYDRWTLAMVGDFNKAKINGTPTIKIDGKEVDPQKVPAELQKMGVDFGGAKKGGKPKK